MKLFMLDKSDSTTSVAPILQTKFGARETDKPVLFAGENSFKGMTREDLASTVWLGHADPHSIGNFTAKQLAEKFEREFYAAEFKDEDKKFIFDFYTIGCGAAFRMGDQRALIQTIADELYKKGFENVCVHGVANKPTKDFVAMHVHVITRVGTGVLFGATPGGVFAYLLTAEQQEEINKHQERITAIDKKLKTLEKERIKKYADSTKKAIAASKIKEKDLRTDEELALIKEKTQLSRLIKKIEDDAKEKNLVINTQDIHTELDGPDHAAYPTRKKFTRSELIKQVTINWINEQIKQLSKTGKEDEATTLKQLKSNIRRDLTEEWPRQIEDYRKKNFSGFFSSGGGLLTELYAAVKNALEFQKDKLGIGEQVQRFSEQKPVERPVSPLPAKQTVASEPVKQKEKPKKLWEKITDAVIPASAKKPVEALKEEVVNMIKKEPEPMPKDLEIAINNIEALAAIQQKEIENYPKVIRSTKFFEKKIMGTKKEKIDTLTELATQLKDSYDKYCMDFKKDNTIKFTKDLWMIHVKALLKEENRAKHPKLLVSRFSSRTKNLLENIDQGNSWRGILQPLGKPVDPDNLTDMQKKNPVIKKELEKNSKSDLRWHPPEATRSTKRFW